MFRSNKRIMEDVRAARDAADARRAEIEATLRSAVADEHRAARVLRKEAEHRINALFHFERMILGLLRDHAGDETADAVESMLAVERNRQQDAAEKSD